MRDVMKNYVLNYFAQSMGKGGRYGKILNVSFLYFVDWCQLKKIKPDLMLK